jgi:hypothetical protein
MPTSLLEPYRHQAYIPARRALDALTALHKDLIGNTATTLDGARIRKILPLLERYVATLKRIDGDHFNEYPRVVEIIGALNDIHNAALESIIGDLEHSRTEIGNS